MVMFENPKEDVRRGADATLSVQETITLQHGNSLAPGDLINFQYY